MKKIKLIIAVAVVTATCGAGTQLFAQNNENGRTEQNYGGDDDHQCWGLAGLLGLIGLAGLRKNRDNHMHTNR